TLDETATLFHDDLRWGRLPAAETSVDGRLRAAFSAHHRGWGSQVQLMDMDVEGIRAAPGAGTVRMRVQWTHGADSTDVRESLIEEQWEVVGGAWRLRNESVLAGDPGIFGPTTAASR